MKFNSILLIIFCLLQALICSTDESIEQSLVDVTAKIINFAKIYHEENMKLKDTENLQDLKMYCAPLILDNIKFKFDENGNLHIIFVNLKLVVSGKYNYGLIFFKGVNNFAASLNDFYWEEIFEVSKTELENGQLDIKFKLVAESAFNYNIFLHNNDANSIEISNLNVSFSLENSLKDLLKKSIDFNPLKNQFKKVSQLIFEAFKSDFK